MKRIPLIVALFVVFVGNSFSQQQTDYKRFEECDSTGKRIWGCIERVSGDTIHKAQFRRMDKVESIGFRYSVGEYWGLMDSTCRVIFSADDYHYVNKYFVDGEWYWVTSNREGKNGLYSSQHKQLLPETYSRIQPLNHLLIAVQKDSLCGVMNSKLDWLIEPKFSYVHKFDRGYAKTSIGYNSGFIDEKGNEVITPRYSVTGNINSNRLCVSHPKTGKKGYLNLKDELVIPFKLIQAFPFNTGYARVYNYKELDSFPPRSTNLKARMGLIDTNGNWVVEPKYNQVVRTNTNYWTAYDEPQYRDTFYVKNFRPLPNYHYAHNAYTGFGKGKDLVVIMHQDGKRYGMEKRFLFSRNREWQLNKLYWVTNLANDTLTKEPHEYMAYSSKTIFLKHFGKWKYFDEEKGKMKPVRKLPEQYHITKNRPYDDAKELFGVIFSNGRMEVPAYFDKIELVKGELVCTNERVVQRFDLEGNYLGVNKVQ